ncbi:MAG: hypothetical protein AMXMBFR7_09210 [Planctomycetota bacterium]
MLISQTSEYALRAIVSLAERHGESVVTQDLAQRTRIPAGYLSKILQTLRRAGLVHSQRGLRGGFVLQRAPEKISVLEVIDAIEPIRRVTRCPLNLPEHDAGLCPLHRRLDEAIDQVRNTFASFSIADLLDESRRGVSRGLCETATAPAR